MTVTGVGCCWNTSICHIGMAIPWLLMTDRRMNFCLARTMEISLWKIIKIPQRNMDHKFVDWKIINQLIQSHIYLWCVLSMFIVYGVIIRIKDIINSTIYQARQDHIFNINISICHKILPCWEYLHHGPSFLLSGKLNAQDWYHFIVDSM